MKKKIITLFATIIFCAQYASAQNMRELIKTMPDSIIPLLSKNNKLDFMDYLDSKMKAEITNKLGGKSEMTVITEDYTFIKTTTNSTIEIKLLPFGDEKIIALVQSVSLDSIHTDSQIEFFSTSWKSIPKSSYINFHDDENFCAMHLDSTNTDLNISFTNPLQLDKDAKDRTPAVMKWTGTKYNEQ
ncbi:MAG: DUF3256 family protein [Bacteroidaceae bacterium]|nr:DUF3256 family protein [Bacteroidaceae bacterium]